MVRLWGGLKWQGNDRNRQGSAELKTAGDTGSGLKQNGSNGKEKGNTRKRHEQE